jgi:hypothetical protein
MAMGSDHPGWPLWAGGVPKAPGMPFIGSCAQRACTIRSHDRFDPPECATPGFWATQDSAWWSAVAAFLNFITGSISAIASFRSARQAAVANLRVTLAALSVAFNVPQYFESNALTLTITNGGPGSAQDIKAWVAKESTYRIDYGSYYDPELLGGIEQIWMALETYLPHTKYELASPVTRDDAGELHQNVIVDWSDSLGNREQIHLQLSALRARSALCSKEVVLSCTGINPSSAQNTSGLAGNQGYVFRTRG